MRWRVRIVAAMKVLVLAFLVGGVANGQQTVVVAKVPAIPEVRTTVTVVGTPDAIAVGDSPRTIEVMDVQAHPLAFVGVDDFLRNDPSVDLEQRGGAGVQTDVTIRGGSFEQVLVLLNGLRINDVETSHFNLDLPVLLEMIGSVNVLHGAGSTLYGSDAVSGVVGFKTMQPFEGWMLKLRAGGGSHGEDDDAAVASWGGRHASEVLGGGRDFLDGFITDRDYRSEEVSSETRAETMAGKTDVLLGTSDRRFGANQFYGNYDSWERTKGWFAGLNQQIDEKTSFGVAYRRHTDEFVLLREAPAVYENNHVDTSWQGVVRRRDDLPWRGASVFYGLEEDADQIHSTNLGRHGRNRGAGYGDFELRGKSWGTISAGLREEIFDGGQAVATPSFAASAWVKKRLKLRAAVTRGFRQPTFTDLYYSDPTTVGNAALKAESAWSYEGGADFYLNAKLTVTGTVFHSDVTNAIDYVRANPTVKWQAENLSGVTFTGFEGALDWRPVGGQEFRLGLTTLAGAQSALGGLQSEYVFNYPVQNAVAEWVGRWKSGLLLRNRVRVVNRVDRGVSPVWDASAVYEGRRVQPYLQLTNLSNTNYQEIVGVQMPNRAIVGGVQVVLRRRRD